MVRIIKHTRNQPFKVEVEESAKWVCGCGLSKSIPYCDGSHNKTKDEKDDVIYWYDDIQNQKTIEIDLPVMPNRYNP